MSTKEGGGGGAKTLSAKEMQVFVVVEKMLDIFWNFLFQKSNIFIHDKNNIGVGLKAFADMPAKN